MPPTAATFEEMWLDLAPVGRSASSGGYFRQPWTSAESELRTWFAEACGSRDLVVETDGLRYHRTTAQQAKDRRRDQAHVAAGLTALRFTHAQVVRESEYVEETLAAVHGTIML